MNNFHNFSMRGSERLKESVWAVNSVKFAFGFGVLGGVI